MNKMPNSSTDEPLSSPPNMSSTTMKNEAAQSDEEGQNVPDTPQLPILIKKKKSSGTHHHDSDDVKEETTINTRQAGNNVDINEEEVKIDDIQEKASGNAPLQRTGTS